MVSQNKSAARQGRPEVPDKSYRISRTGQVTQDNWRGLRDFGADSAGVTEGSRKRGKRFERNLDLNMPAFVVGLNISESQSPTR